MGVVLGELPDAHEPGQRARPLVAVQAAHVREAQRQVPVRAQRVTIDQRGLRAVHRLEAEDLLLGLHQEHVLAEVVPVTGLLPQPLVDQDRRGDLLVAAGVQDFAHEPLQLAHHRPAVGQPEGRARRDIVEGVEVELAPELAVVALLGLLDPPEVPVQLFLREPGGAVDPLEHGVPLVAAPVGAGRRQQLEEADRAGGRHVGPPAEIDELPLLVDRHARSIERFQDLHLERLAPLPEEADRLATVHLPPLERETGRDDVAHAGLDLGQVLRRERRGPGEVVVEAVLDGGADRQLDVRVQAFHRLSHDVRSGVPERGERRRIAVELAGQLEVSVFFSLGHTLLAGGGMVGSGGFEPPTSSASERRSPTELRAYPSKVAPMLHGGRRGCQAKRPRFRANSPEHIGQRGIHHVIEVGHDRNPGAALPHRDHHGRGHRGERASRT